MAAPIWQPGTIYIPGDLVQPVSGTPAAGQPIVNPGPTGSAAGWTLNAPWVYDGTKGMVPGQQSFKFDTGFSGFAVMQATAGIPVSPGVSITASCLCEQGASSAGLLGLQVLLSWSDASDVNIGTSLGNVVNVGTGGAIHQSTVTGVAPAGAAYVRIGAAGNRIGENLPAWVGNFQWNYTNAGAPAGLIYKAVQPASGVSGSQEPVWPTTLGVQVIDNTVTWEAIAATRVTWEASPVLVSGASEPTWPTQIGGTVADGSILWTAFSRRVEDVNCPNSKVVAIVQSKVFAADGDIVRYCATANPLDWTTERDAGYLPTGLQQANANDMAVLNQYRSNLVAFNASSFQNWQADPDPEVMAILDQMDGIGSTWQQAARPVGNELFYLSQLGVRTVGIAGGSTNLQAGDVGMPVDPLVQESIKVAYLNSLRTLSTYYPSAGQYWLVFPDYPPPEITVTGDMQDAFVSNSGTFQYQISGGAGVKTATIVAGALPPGATMDALGLVTFTYTTRGLYAWTVRVTDQLGNYTDHDDGMRVFELVWSYDWTRINTNLTGGINYAPITFGPGAPRVAYTNGAGAPSWTDDLSNWNAGTPSIGDNIRPSAWSPSLGKAFMVADGATNSVYTSTDLKAWTQGTYSGTSLGADVMVRDEARGFWISFGGTPAEWRKSVDGVTVTSGTFGAGVGPDAVIDMAINGSRYVFACGSDQTQNKRLAWSDDGGLTFQFATATGNYATTWVSANPLKGNLFGVVGDTGSAAGRRVLVGPGNDAWVDVTPAGLTTNLASIAYIPELDLAVLIPNNADSGDTLSTFWTSTFPISSGSWVARTAKMPGGNHHQMRWMGAPFYKLGVVSTGGTAGNGFTFSNITAVAE